MEIEKTAVRQALKWKRMELTTAEHTLKNRAIAKNLEAAVDWSKVKSVHFFEPIAQLMEVDLNDFISSLQDRYPGMSFYTPKQIEGVWENVGLQAGKVPDHFDVIIVPMLGFDPATRHRIGYGGGFYDKFLANQPTVRKIGVCFEEGRVDKLPVEAHDIALDLIVTEENLYQR